jgi:hypothetical protein
MEGDYYDVYSYNTNFIRGGVTELPTGMSILRHSDIMMRIGDTLFDRNYNLYVLDITNMRKVYLHSLKSFFIWITFWCLTSILSFFKMLRVADQGLWLILMISIFIISLLILLVSLISFLCGANCYGIEIYEYRLRNKINSLIKYLLIVSGMLIIYILI